MFSRYLPGSVKSPGAYVGAVIGFAAVMLGSLFVLAVVGTFVRPVRTIVSRQGTGIRALDAKAA